MDGMMVKEMAGYVASLVILVSLVTTNVFRLRLLNGAGSVLFSAYGFAIGSWPVGIINAVIAGIDVWYLAKTMRSSEFFELLPAGSVGEEYLRRFFLYHERELVRDSPGLTLEELKGAETWVLFRNLLPVGLFAYRQDGEDARVVTDFMVPEYRDFKAGRYLYRTKRLFFKERGIKRFCAVAAEEAQRRYLKKNGFTREEEGGDRFVCEL